MKRLAKFAMTALAAGMAALLVGASLASASGAFFKSASSSVNSSGALVVSFDERGLGNANVNLLLTADATATYACINGGGNHPKAANKSTVQAQVSTGVSFQPKNGRIVATIISGPLSAGSFSCPSGQTLVLASVSYTGVVLTDTTNNVSTNVANASRVFFNV